MNMSSLKSFYNDVMIIIYRKILLIRLGRIYGQKKNLMGLYSRWGRGAGGGVLIFGRKNTSISNLLNLLFFLFSSVKNVFLEYIREERGLYTRVC